MFRKSGEMDRVVELQMDAISYLKRALDCMRAANQITDPIAISGQRKTA